ncbi:peptidylprolyl isomerase [Saitozyma sp. JCM 24511]|nr:peptidylprolyl isomerase [Saitozyma sp. JCM 24511]
MSNLYVTEPATNGKVIIDTTAGEIEVELWGKEAPKAVRNFLQLAMEGYYDGVIFHRIVPGFIIQTGDPTGTGTGGDSIYGEPFQDEIHGRLRFNRRGLMGMANRGKRNTNTSQFFFTLDRADELTNKHTLFGRIQGDTIYNVLDIGKLDIDEEERPKRQVLDSWRQADLARPPKIRGIRIVENPFDDIVPRITAAERRAQAQARIEAKKEMEIRERRARAKKNTGLLSFGDEEEIPEAAMAVKKKGISRQDLRESTDSLPKTSETFVELAPSLKDLGTGKREKAEIKRMQDDLRKLKKRAGDASDSDSDDSETRRKKRRAGPSYLEQELAKYSKGRGRAAAKAGNRRGRRDEEDDLLKEMSRFSSKVAQTEEDDTELPDEAGEGTEEGMEIDDDVGWMRHRLTFVVDEKELTRRAEEEYSVIDPRAKARQLADEQRRDKESQRRGARTAADVGRGR